MIFLAMIPLAVGLAMDVFLLGCMIFHSTDLAVGAALLLLGVFVGLWFVFPALSRRYPAEEPPKSTRLR
jgi:hypothetical protein